MLVDETGCRSRVRQCIERGRPSPPPCKAWLRQAFGYCWVPRSLPELGGQLKPIMRQTISPARSFLWISADRAGEVGGPRQPGREQDVDQRLGRDRTEQH